MPKLGQTLSPNRAGLPDLDIAVGKRTTMLDGPRRAFAGQTTVSAAESATRLPTKPIRTVTIKSNGVAPIYIGDASVSKTTGFLLEDELTMYIGRLDTLYIWSTDANAGVYWIGA